VLTDILYIVLNYECLGGGGALLSCTRVSHIGDYGELRDKMARSPVKVNRRCGETSFSFSRSKSRPACYQFHSGFLLGLLSDPED
jgi:hypothetical protein